MVKNMFSVGIIGCGSIGNKRAKALGARGKLVACADTDFKKADTLAKTHNATPFDNWADLLKIDEIDIVIISTLHDSLAEITLAAVRSNKHVLVEKPAARSASELEQIISSIESTSFKVRVGFNHRYHRSLLKAKEIVVSGVLGKIMFLRGRYGHGARVGYDREWRANPILSGGGELIDQGPHLIDLSRWFIGDFIEVQGLAKTYYWNMPVDDNAFMILKTASEQVAFLHVSCTEWKNLFSMEIYGTQGKLDISGLGGSYGVERITHFNMLPEMGPPETQSWEYPMGDNSWETEMSEFYDDISLDRQPTAGLLDAYEALKVIKKVYMGEN
ncbi:Gfo/Idh/MocA family oxidoreductase [Planktomarina temperata]|nr:Gfo/Idh/MocA family oxidoreductase [Planktomarina temperata]